MIQPHHLPPALRGSADDMPRSGKSGLTLKALEATHIADAIRRHGGNRAAAAKELGINPSTLFRKIKAFGLRLPDQDGRARKE